MLVDELNSKIEGAEDEDRTIEVTQTEEQRENRLR